jgi:hypothetical protein
MEADRWDATGVGGGDGFREERDVGRVAVGDEDPGVHTGLPARTTVVRSVSTAYPPVPDPADGLDGATW